MKRIAQQDLRLTELAIERARRGDHRVFTVLIAYEGALARLDDAQFESQRQMALMDIQECEKQLREMCG